MRKRDLIIMANKNLWRRKARTILTCLGVLIGTASIVVMLSLGIGLKQTLERDMARWGSLNIINIYPGRQYDHERNPIGDEHRLNDETVNELKGIPGVVAVSPAYEVNGEARLGRKGLAQYCQDGPRCPGRIGVYSERWATAHQGRSALPSWPVHRSLTSFGMNVPNMIINRGLPQQDPAELLNQRISVSILTSITRRKKRIIISRL